MGAEDKIEYLIVDTSAFIKNAPLQDIGINVLTEETVVGEITNKRQLRRLVVLPYDLEVKTAFPEDVKFVTEFAKKTGDYTSLSATDIKVIALTYQLEKEKVGIEHLKETPTVPKTVAGPTPDTDNYAKPLVGFYMPEKEKNCSRNCLGTTECDINCKDVEVGYESASNSSGRESDTDYETAPSDIEPNIDTDIESNKESNAAANDLHEKFSTLSSTAVELEVEDSDGDNHNVDDILPVVNHDNRCQEVSPSSSDSDTDADDDDNNSNGWITPYNIKDMKKQINLDMSEKKAARVACLTTDFAMQNVLMQIGLNVASLEGRVIKQMRTFIFRCYACFKTTSIMTKIFCPNCGNKTLKKVAVSIDDEGKQQIHINFRKPLSSKGKRFPLPMPKGGKHANNPILCDDQPMPEQRPSRLARMKNDPLQEDYTAGYSPFVMRDVHSRSAMLGIRSAGTLQYWMKRNPNESRKKKK